MSYFKMYFICLSIKILLTSKSKRQMKITSFTGVEAADSIRCFKPISKLLIRVGYPTEDANAVDHDSNPLLRVQLVDGSKGSSADIIPETNLLLLSEIASKYEGFQRRAGFGKTAGGANMLLGWSNHTIVLGSQLSENSFSAVDLSNDKYINIDMRGLDPKCTYEVWGFESHIISPFVRTYKKFYLSTGELEKSFSTGDCEALVLPVEAIKEIQMFPKNGSASPVYRKEELILDEDSRNDLVYVRLDDENTLSLETDAGSICFGYDTIAILSISDFDRFEIRREVGATALTFIMIDTKPSSTSVIQATA